MTDQAPELLPQVSLPRWWLELLRDQLFAMKKLPTGYVGDWVFMFREQLNDVLESRPTPSERPPARDQTRGERDYATLFKRLQRGDGSFFVTAPGYTGFSFILGDSQDDVQLNEAFVKFLAINEDSPYSPAVRSRDDFLIERGLWSEYSEWLSTWKPVTSSTPSEPVAQVREAITNEHAGCICQDQHRRGYCTEPKCSYRNPAAFTAERPAEAAVAWRCPHGMGVDLACRLIADGLECVCDNRQLAIPHREAVAWTEEERHAIAHARHQVEQASPESPDCCFDFDLVKDLLRVIDRSIPHGDAVRAQTIEECAKVLEALYNAKLPEGTYSSDVYEGLAVAIDSIRALSRVQAISTASATACDHLTTEKVAPWAAALEDLADTLEQMRGYPPDDADEKEELCSDLCGAVCCNEFGCMHEKVRIARSLIANQENLLGSEPEPTLASERVSERETMTSVPKPDYMLRGGRGFDYPCNDPSIIECAKSECQVRRRCTVSIGIRE